MLDVIKSACFTRPVFVEQPGRHHLSVETVGQKSCCLYQSFGVGRTEPSARYDLTQTSPVTSERRSLVGDLRVREVSYVLSPMYNVSVEAVDSSTPLPRHSVAIHTRDA